jgi:hypothetical protein
MSEVQLVHTTDTPKNMTMVNKYAVTILFLVPGFSFIGCQPVGSSDIRNRNPTSGVKVELKVAACQPTNLPGLGDAILGVLYRRSKYSMQFRVALLKVGLDQLASGLGKCLPHRYLVLYRLGRRPVNI